MTKYKIIDNGVYRDMTPEEVTAMEEAMSQIPPPAPDPMQEQLRQMQAQIDALIEGRTG